LGKKRQKLRGTVEKVIGSVIPSQPEEAQIVVEGADDLYREIRIENAVTDDNGVKGHLGRLMSSLRRTQMLR
jgi:hypothetical protein